MNHDFYLGRLAVVQRELEDLRKCGVLPRLVRAEIEQAWYACNRAAREITKDEKASQSEEAPNG